MNTGRLVGILALIVCCSACGGGGGDSPATAQGSTAAPPAPSPSSAGGLWFAPSGGMSALQLMIAEDGHMRVTGPPTQTTGPAFGYGAVVVTGNRVEGSYETRTVQPSLTSPIAQDYDCTLDGTVTTRSSMQATIACTDNLGMVTTNDRSFLYDSRYDSDSSLATIAGTYTLSVNSGANTLMVYGDGTLSGIYQNGPRCTIGGHASVIHPDFNLYRFEMTFSACTVLDRYEGVTMTGFATHGLPGQPAGSFYLLLTAVVEGRLEFISVIYQPV
jgi:hypothetical protein